jgi:hypothetical protein
MRSSLAAACFWRPLRNAVAYAPTCCTRSACAGPSISRTLESSIASKKYCVGVRSRRLVASASHHVSGANWTMCSLPFASMT